VTGVYPMLLVQIRPLQPKFILFQSLRQPPQPSEFVILVVRRYLDFVAYSPMPQILTGFSFLMS
jgi:hypothetical protein